MDQRQMETCGDVAALHDSSLESRRTLLPMDAQPTLVL